MSEPLACRILAAALWVAIPTGLLACQAPTRIRSPLEVHPLVEQTDVAIGLHVPVGSRRYVWKGHINVVPHRVEFGGRFERNVRHALETAFAEVVPIHKFPPDGGPGPLDVVSVRIVGAEVGVVPSAVELREVAAPGQ